MRLSEFSIAVPCALALLASSASNVAGQQQQPRPKAAPAATTPPQTNGQPARPPVAPTGKSQPGNVTQVAAKEQRPQADMLSVPKLSPELEEILREWEAKSSLIKTIHGKHTRTVYNIVFEVEKIAEGKFYLETPDKGRIDLVGITPKKGEKSVRKGESGNEFRLEADQAEKWICDGKGLFAVNDEEKTYEVVPIPEDAQGKNIVNTPLPFLFGMKSDDMKRRYRIKLDKNDKSMAILFVYPRQEIDQQNYSEAWIILDKKTYLPSAVKLFDPTAQLETVYKFSSVVVNAPEPKSIMQKIFGTNDADPFHPNFKKEGYKLVLTSTSNPPANEQPTTPNSAVRRTPPGTSTSSQLPPNQTPVRPAPNQTRPTNSR